MTIGLISDTHGLIPPDVLEYLSTCDEVWHAGDLGQVEVIDQIPESNRAHWVYGNIDDHKVRSILPEFDFFEIEGLRVLIIHIGGYPGRYSSKGKELIGHYQPDLFISGHSHILKIVRDKKRDLLHMNPGACGFKGFHKARTFILFDINQGKIGNVRVVELERRSSI